MGQRRGIQKKNIGAYQVGWRLSTYVSGPAGMERLGARIVRLPLPRVWLLRGPLGAGKTTLVRGVLRSLGIKRSVNSPTFNLVKHYHPRGPWRSVVHVDAYRVRSASEIHALGLREVLADPKTLVLIEWPERLPTMRWPIRTEVSFKHRWPGRSVVVKIVRKAGLK